MQLDIERWVKRRRIRRDEVKSLPVTKGMVYDAYRKVKSNGGASGVDGQSLTDFEGDLSNQLYKLWSRLSSGSYFPPAVKRVTIPKRGGGQRPLGIPTVGDRVAQTVLKEFMEPRLERIFHDSSYGYRPQRSAHDALRKVDKTIREYYWVIDLDIKGFFDALDHDKLLLALDQHFPENWVKMYVTRWLKAAVVHADGSSEEPTSGSPQGGVISPLLANLYLHYSFDKWLDKSGNLPFARYADDIIIHCKSVEQAEEMLGQIRQRMAECGLELHPTKTKIVYCGPPKKKREVGGYARKFTFLGHDFKPRRLYSVKYKRAFWFTRPGPSEVAKQSMIEVINSIVVRGHPTGLSCIAEKLASKLMGWQQYYCKFHKRALKGVMSHLNNRLVKWLSVTHKRHRRSLRRSWEWLRRVYTENPKFFYHWQCGYTL